MKRSCYLILLVSLLMVAHAAPAACNNPKDWWQSPSQGVEVFFDVDFEKGVTIELLRRLSKERYGMESLSAFDPMGIQEIDAMGERFLFRGEIEKNQIDPAKFEQKRDVPSSIYFYEPDGKGGRRLCRKEYLKEKPRVDDTSFKELNSRRLRSLQSNKTFHPRIKAYLASGNYYLYPADAYIYDAQGRISAEYTPYNADKPNGQLASACYFYDAAGHLTEYIRPRRHKTCDAVDIWDDARLLRYNKTGRLIAKGSRSSETGRFRYGGGYQFYYPLDDSPKASDKGGVLNFDSVFGVYDIASGWCLHFRKRPPVEWTDDLFTFFQKVQTLDRVDICAENDIPRLAFYPANSTTPTYKIYRDHNAYVLRQEQYDKNGKLLRVINRGDPKEAMELEFYKENLSKYSVSHSSLWYRVYDYDAKGQEKLVAVSWLPMSVARIGAVFSKKMKQDAIQQQRFGLPDGTVKWPNEASFQKAFGFLPDPWETFFGKETLTAEQADVKKYLEEKSCLIKINPDDIKLDGKPLNTEECDELIKRAKDLKLPLKQST